MKIDVPAKALKSTKATYRKQPIIVPTGWHAFASIGTELVRNGRSILNVLINQQ